MIILLNYDHPLNYDDHPLNYDDHQLNYWTFRALVFRAIKIARKDCA